MPATAGPSALTSKRKSCCLSFSHDMMDGLQPVRLAKADLSHELMNELLPVLLASVMKSELMDAL